MARYNSTSLALAEETAAQDCFSEVEGYLSSEGGYWQTHDIWMKDAGAFSERKISLEGVKGSVIADFSTLPDGRLKTELKYYALWSLSMGVICASTFTENYKSAVKDLGELLISSGCTPGLTEAVIAEDELQTRAGQLSIRTPFFAYLAGRKRSWRIFMTSGMRQKRTCGGHCVYPGHGCQQYRSGQSRLSGSRTSLSFIRKLSRGTCAVWLSNEAGRIALRCSAM